MLRKLRAEVECVETSACIVDCTRSETLTFGINPLKPKFLIITFKISVRTAKNTPHVCITSNISLMLLKEMIPAYSKNHTSVYTECTVTDY
jgi:hypothetical protein